MNIHFNKDKKRVVEDVSKRVANTKKEIEQLKDNLQKLISTGVESTIPKFNLEPKVLEQKSEFKHIEIQSQTKKIIPAPLPNKSETFQTSPLKKTRSYNVAEARDFIKKQREKRAEQLKVQINKADNQVDLKKQKLKELHKKTIELVNRNVQLKRERSKSRDREPAIRIDKSNIRQRSQEKGKPKIISNSKSQQRQKVSQQVCSRDHSVERAKSQDRNKSQSRDRQTSQTRRKSQVRGKTQTQNGVIGQEKTQLHKSQNGRQSRPRNREKEPVLPKSEKVNLNLLHPLDFELHTEKPEITLEKTIFPHHQNLDHDDVDLNKAVFLDETVFEDKEIPEPRIPKQLLEHSIITDACLKDTKETQTNRINNFGDVPWLQPPQAAPYPYNFINTVKRKLQFAINSPRSCVDVGVQKSCDHTPQFRSREEIKELLIKSTSSDVKSFESHKKCPSLDLKKLENLELIPNNNSSNNNNNNKMGASVEAISKNLFDNYDSESDTSKNIPEISSESLSLSRVRNLKLQKLPQSLSHHTNIETDTNGWEKDDYSSDFQKETSVESVRSKLEKSSSTKKTLARDQKQSDVISSNNKVTISHTVSDDRLQNRSEISDFNASINSDRRNTLDSQNSFKSLITDGQLSYITDDSRFSIPEKLSWDCLKEPSVSLKGKRNDLTSTSDKSWMKTMTIEQNFKDQNSVENSQRISRSVKIGDKFTSGVESLKDNLKLKEPTVSLTFDKDKRNNELVESKMKNITLRPAISTANNVNEIHLKFEAEVRLLNDFNESFKQFVAVEKAFESLKNKNEVNLATKKILQNVDTQTSFMTKTSTNISTEKSSRGNRTSSINYSRGSEIIEDLDDSIPNSNNQTLSKSLQNGTLSSDWNLSNLNESNNTYLSTGEEDRSRLSISNIENYNTKNCAVLLSLNMFDQLIKDEDTRIQQLKAIIKIREQALLDRTKSELVFLDIQKKQLIETGKIEEASLLKKKQRGIILKHEQERNEIKKLKQMQKEASEHRKNTLKQQRNLIKAQLSTEQMLSKITVVKKCKERRSTGPLKVVQSCSESIHSEASISLKSSGIEDVLSVTSKSVKFSEESELDFPKVDSSKLKEDEVRVSKAKRTLLMREAALQKRRKAAEELLQWHRKLLEEERKINELEAAATSVIKTQDRYRLTGKQLNQLWKNMTGSDANKFVDEKSYVMSQDAFERLCKSARQYANKRKKKSEIENSVGEDAKKSSDDVNYSSVFEPESVQEIINSQEEKTKISSISELIDNFSRIEDEISTLSKKSEEMVSLKEDPEKSSQSIDEIMAPKRVSEAEEIQEDSEISSAREFEEEEQRSVVEVLEEKIEETATRQIPVMEEETEQTPDERLSPMIEDQNKVDQEITTSIEEIEKTEPPKIEETVSLKTERTADEFSEEIEIDDPGEPTSYIATEPNEEEIKETCKNVEKTSLSLDEALASASKIEESLSKLNEKLVSEEKTQPNTSLEATEITEESRQEITAISSKTSEEGKKPSLSTGKSRKTKSSMDSEEEIESLQVSAESDQIISEASTKTKVEEEEKKSESKNEISPDEKISQEKTESALISTETEDHNIQDKSATLSVSTALEEEQSQNKSEISSVSTDENKTPQKKNESEIEEKTPHKRSPSNQIDVKKRVSEILADASLSRGDKSPRLQDLYITAYDVTPPNAQGSSEILEEGRQLPTDIFGSEAEELWRKQLAIEQEIKQIELQQKEQIPYLYMREIPNKPPPPYTPPSSLSSLSPAILPTEIKEITEIASYSSKVLHKAHQNHNLDKVKFSENGFKLFSKTEVGKICAEFMFNICRDIAKNHYKQFETIEEPSWLILAKKPQLAKTKPPDAARLERIFTNRLKELFGFKKIQVAESAIIKWGRKKRDHVDEVLVTESQEEESQWTNFDKDELIVKNQLTDDIMNMLIGETASVFAKILSKKKQKQG